MIEIVYTVCLVTGYCVSREDLFNHPDAPTPMECARNGQLAVSQWVEAHPGWAWQGDLKCRWYKGRIAKA